MTTTPWLTLLGIRALGVLVGVQGPVVVSPHGALAAARTTLEMVRATLVMPTTGRR